MSARTDLIDRLGTHRLLGGSPRRELEWLADRGTFRRYPAGDLAMRKGDVVYEMMILLSGHVVINMERGSGRRTLLESRGGEVTALLPFSRATTIIGDARVEEDTDTLVVHRDLFPEMIRECPAVIERLVHFMLDRSRLYASAVMQDERLQSLSRLAAGLAHELDNPAAAALRSARSLRDALQEAVAAARALGAAALSEDQQEAFADLTTLNLTRMRTGVFSALERSDREEDLAGWLEAHHVDAGLAGAMVESALDTGALDHLADVASGATLGVMLRAIASEYTVTSLSIDVERAARRIHDLVSSVRRFTNLGRAPAPGLLDVAQGIEDTVTMLAMKARAKSAAIRLSIAPDLPPVLAGDELNQAWANLIDNALDAVDAPGEVRVVAGVERDEVVIRVVDNGPGIPPEVEARMFEPFFTTKPQGQGAGLGLDITRRIVVANAGQITVETRPGRTEFRVSLPVPRAAAVTPTDSPVSA